MRRVGGKTSAPSDPSQDPNPPVPTTREEQPSPRSSEFLMSHPPEPPSPPWGKARLHIPRKRRVWPHVANPSVLTYPPP